VLTGENVIKLDCFDACYDSETVKLDAKDSFFAVLQQAARTFLLRVIVPALAISRENKSIQSRKQ